MADLSHLSDWEGVEEATHSTSSGVYQSRELKDQTLARASSTSSWIKSERL